MKGSAAGTKKISPDGLVVARAYRPPGVTIQIVSNTLSNIHNTATVIPRYGTLISYQDKDYQIAH